MSSYSGFHRKLHSWYGKHGRKDLPWRNTNDAYAIYVSEVMLQQTQVKTVLERYYAPFLKRFPTLSALAKAKEQDVLSAWQGLGYYSRARNLHKAAQACNGELPKDISALTALPGIGRNTAHAIAAFAHHQPAPVMEANVKRVLCRIFALTQPTTQALWEKAESLLDTKKPFDYNQAMMDLGSAVCTKRTPNCATCPANDICAGKDAPQHYPQKAAKRSVPTRNKAIIIEQNHHGEYRAMPRTTRFLQGLYHFMEYDTLPRSKTIRLGHIQQQYSHFTLEADVYLLKVGQTSGKHWYPLAKLKKLPFSMAEKKILKMLP